MIDYILSVLFEDCRAYLGPNFKMDLSKET